MFTATLAVAGEYVLVFNRRPSDEISRQAPLPFLMTAHAQEGEREGDEEENGPTIYTRNFTVTADVPPEACGSFIFDEDLIEPIEDCDNPFG